MQILDDIHKSIFWTEEQRDTYINTLPANKQSGSIFINENDHIEYLQFYLTSVLIMSVFWYLSAKFNLRFNKNYQSRSQPDRDYYDSLVNNIVFVILCLGRLYWFILNSVCDANDGIEHKSWLE